MTKFTSRALEARLIRAFRKMSLDSKHRRSTHKPGRASENQKKTLISLPNELLLEITEQFLPGIKDISSLVLVNRRFYQLFALLLIRRGAQERTCPRIAHPGGLYTIGSSSSKRRSVVHWAAAHGDYNLLEKLLDEKITKPPSSRGGRSHTVSGPIVKKKDLVNDLDWFGLSPLASAVLNKHTTIVQLLITNGADTNWTPKYESFSLIHVAVFCGLHEILDCLLNGGATPNVFDMIAYGTPLHLAVALNDSYSIRSLCRAGALSYYGFWRLTPMNLACQLNRSEAKQILIESRLAHESQRNGFFCPLPPGHLKRIRECTLDNIMNDLQWKNMENTDYCCRCRRLDPRFGVNRSPRT